MINCFRKPFYLSCYLASLIFTIDYDDKIFSFSELIIFLMIFLDLHSLVSVQANAEQGTESLLGVEVRQPDLGVHLQHISWSASSSSAIVTVSVNFIGIFCSFVCISLRVHLRHISWSASPSSVIVTVSVNFHPQSKS